MFEEQKLSGVIDKTNKNNAALYGFPNLPYTKRFPGAFNKDDDYHKKSRGMTGPNVICEEHSHDVIEFKLNNP